MKKASLLNEHHSPEDLHPEFEEAYLNTINDLAILREYCYHLHLIKRNEMKFETQPEDIIVN